MSKENHEKSALVPRLRFPEFREAGEWGSEFGGELFDQISNKDHNSDIPVLAITQEHGAVPRSLIDYHVSVADKSIEGYKVVEVGDFIISLRSFQGGIEYSRYRGICSPAYVILRLVPGHSADYFRHLLKTDRFVVQLTKNLEGLRDGKMVSYKQFSELQLSTPSRKEQQKIADCLSSLDELITAETQKLDALKTHKKGLMQQLFPHEGETVPRLRFPEFQAGGEWHGRELGEFISERTQLANDGEPLFSLTIEDGVTPKTERYERSFLVNDETDAYKLMEPDDFAYNPMNLRFGAIGRHRGSANVAVSKYYNIFYCDQSVDAKFCAIYFKSDQMVAFYDRVAIGSLVEKRRVHFSDFLKFVIPFPTLGEQQRIADCLSSLDDLIIAQSQKIAALKNHKQGLMQQLFPALDEAQA